ncbi:Signal recognition particle subunit Srp54 [Klebsormidium nitens]|uniref:Signal recognition particle 54 kDa protein n=1 Tax=Klebsormidium nitens TaxID=105231 RepID=A0A1Y1HR43_KLENI|nr:Signal recognition particle subunit Srp54 [Klebsormidium nitens]|eukprot:GAQ81104.1 Signal recognition particle subunit Srp54 [Klebsormidium nitens]
MVLAELGGRITAALQSMTNATVIDEAVLKECLNEIASALLQADVNVKFVKEMRDNIKKVVNFDDLAAGHNKRRIIQQSVLSELVRMLDPGKPAYQLKKGKPNVVMFVGLQGSGKTTTCTKYSYYYQRKGFKPAMVCADTFRAGAFDQLKQNATKAKIPFYGSYTETDPVKIAQEGVERFKAEGCDLIIVDTSGRHKQEAALFEEMKAVEDVVNPDLVIFVMDSSIGQAAFAQAKAFKDTSNVGAVVVTKMDGHAKGGGALSAVAATKSPVIFMGTGEHMDELEVFEAKSFVSRLLGMGDMSSFVNKITEAIPLDQQPELLEKLSQGQFTLRIMYEQFQNIQKMGPLNQNIQKMGPLNQVMSMIPGFNEQLMPKGMEKESQARIKRFMTMMDSMTDEELDSSNLKLIADPSRLTRVARGSGRPLRDVQEMIEEYKKMSKAWNGMKNLKINKKGMLNPANQNQNMAQLSKALPPQVLRQMGGIGGLQNMMKEMNGKDMQGMLKSMGMG